MAAERYVHKDHPKTTCDRKQMQFWMGRSRETQFAWAIFDVLTPEQQAAVLAKFGWTKVPTPGVKTCAPEFDCDADGELLIDWSPNPDRMLSLSLRADGRLSYAFRWDGETAHGTAQMPAGVLDSAKEDDRG